jgi:putative oxidoreductase
VRIATLIIRILLGLIFTIFGLNGFFHFLPNPAMPAAAGQFFGALFATRYMIPLLFATQLIGGILLIIGVIVPFALVILAPVIVNIFFFHLFLDPAGFPPAIVVIVFELFVAWQYRAAFASLFVPAR